MIEQQFASFLVAGYISKLITYDKVILFEPSLKLMQCLCRLAFLDLCDEVWYGREEDVHALHARLYG